MENDGATARGRGGEPNPNRGITSHDIERRRKDGVGNQTHIMGSHPMMKNDGVTARGRGGEPNPYRGIGSNDGELRHGDGSRNQITMRG